MRNRPSKVLHKHTHTHTHMYPCICLEPRLEGASCVGLGLTKRRHSIRTAAPASS